MGSMLLETLARPSTMLGATLSEVEGSRPAGRRLRSVFVAFGLRIADRGLRIADRDQR